MFSPAQFVLRQVVYGRRPASSEPALPAPVNTVLPAISGTETVGQTLSVSNGTWLHSPTAYAYQWKRDGVNIGGATASTYLLVTADATKLISCTVTATNAAGSTPAMSDATGAIFGDPYIASVVLLVGFDGADAATSATDESPSGHALTFVGNAQLDTAAFKFGTASLLLDGNGDRVSAVDSDDFTFDGEFTVEAWARPNVASINGYSIVSHSDFVSAPTEGWSLRFIYTGATTKRAEFTFMGSGGTAGDRIVLQQSSTNIDQSVFHHFTVDRDAAGKMRLYLDGVMVASQTGTGAGRNAATSLRIGAEISFSTPLRQWNGWIDELRITKGVARYASDGGFTVPTAAFPRS